MTDNRDLMTIRMAVDSMIEYSDVRPEQAERFLVFIEYKMRTLVEAVDEYRQANAEQARRIIELEAENKELRDIWAKPFFVGKGEELT